MSEGFIRVRANLTNGDVLDFSEFIKQADELETISYRYQWLNKDKKHIRRWDNALHYPKLENFPDHIHSGENEVMPGGPPAFLLFLMKSPKSSASKFACEIVRNIRFESWQAA